MLAPVRGSIRALAMMVALTVSASAEVLEIKKGDHIAIVGNTLADRMQHDGWLEARLQARFPDSNLVIRNLGFSGDELSLRLRSANFGSPDTWLERVKANVVFAFFGYNESYAGEAGLKKFKTDLASEIKHWQGKQYDGKSAPRVVIFSPIAFENTHNPNLPDGSEHNPRLKMYTTAMKEVAADNHAQFVDLFSPTSALFAKSAKPLTINGIHPSADGNRQLAEVIEKGLFGSANEVGAQKVETIRAGVLEKNHFWYNRYRTTDGYSIYGGRADLKFVNGQTNRVVMDREMEILDVMTANRDKRVWALSQGSDLKVDDSNTPGFVPVVTNKPGPLSGGAHPYLNGQDAIAKMKLPADFQVNLFADETMFPEMANPVQMAFDTKGRLFVAVWPSYPHWKPKDEMNDKIIILEDTNNDGKADKVKTFADKLHNPTGFEFWNGGILLAQAPDLIFLKDTDGDDVADIRQRVLSGVDTADTHHTINSFVIDPGGSLYMQEGTFHHSQVESPWRAPERTANGAVFRFEPRTFKFDAYTSYGFANPHGHVVDAWGQDFVTDGTGAQTYWGTGFSGSLDFPRKHPRMNQVYQQRTRPCSATEILSSKHFPDEFQGNLLVENVIGVLGILRYKFQDAGSGFSAVEQEPLLLSDDPNFRPVDLEVAPDGSVYFVDWHNTIIGHMQHNLRDPNRDHSHGRVYRITHKNRPLVKPQQIAGQPIETLLDQLTSTEDRVRYRVRSELGSRDAKEVLAAVPTWLANLNKTDPGYQHHMMEGLWLHQNLNVVNEQLLADVLKSKDPRARAAATRVLVLWQDRVKEPLNHLQKLVNDDHPRVRLEAVRGLAFFRGADAAKAQEIALESLAHPQDPYLEYVFNETNKTLEARIAATKSASR
ncbi:MAG: GDSL-type esterase/lipase family protein [Planctomycetota bacterium]|nr:GDSL-type esterase/lipase family protein [Planctomycetota bacterium]